MVTYLIYQYGCKLRMLAITEPNVCLCYEWTMQAQDPLISKEFIYVYKIYSYGL